MTQQEYWDMERTIPSIQDPDTREKQEETFDLTQLKDKEIDEKLFKDRKNEFELKLPSKVKITFKLLTHKDEKLVDES